MIIVQTTVQIGDEAVTLQQELEFKGNQKVDDVQLSLVCLDASKFLADQLQPLKEAAAAAQAGAA